MLSDETDKLCNMLSCVKHRGDQHTHILIEEKDPSATLKKATIKIDNGDWFSFDPDRGRKQSGCKDVMSPLLAGGSYHCACDCVIVLKCDASLRIVYIDLKSSERSSYENQFKSVRRFMRYLLGLLEEFHKQSLEITDERYIIIYGKKCKSLDKRPMVPKFKITAPNNAYRHFINDGGEVSIKGLLERTKGNLRR